MMQVPGWLDAGVDVLMQVRGQCDAGPRMVRCRSPDVQIIEMETLSGKAGSLGENHC